MLYSLSKFLLARPKSAENFCVSFFALSLSFGALCSLGFFAPLFASSVSLCNLTKPWPPGTERFQLLFAGPKTPNKLFVRRFSDLGFWRVLGALRPVPLKNHNFYPRHGNLFGWRHFGSNWRSPQIASATLSSSQLASATLSSFFFGGVLCCFSFSLSPSLSTAFWLL